MAEIFDFTKLDHRDGIRVVRVDQKSYAISLHVGLYQETELVPIFNRDGVDATVTVDSWHEPTEVNQGACDRMQMVLEAVCRYLTMGGSWADLHKTLHRLGAWLPFDAVIYAGWHYHSGYINTGGEFEHIFVKDGTEEAVLWVEGLEGFVEPKTLTQIREEQEDDERAAFEEAASSRQTSQLGLPDRTNTGVEG